MTLRLAAAGLIAFGLAACASAPHTDQTMLSHSHPMAPKAGDMPDRMMPQRSPDCSEAALKTMPAKHREMCEAAAKPK